jgi:hypothetical protein
MECQQGRGTGNGVIFRAFNESQWPRAGDYSILYSNHDGRVLLEDAVCVAPSPIFFA